MFPPKNKNTDLFLSLTPGTNNTKLALILKNLGVIFNESLSYNSHAESVCCRLAHTVGVLSSLRSVLPQNVKILIYP